MKNWLAKILRVKPDVTYVYIWPEVNCVPWCAEHKDVASRQQVKGGSYEWMPYCNYRLRKECDIKIIRRRCN